MTDIVYFYQAELRALIPLPLVPSTRVVQSNVRVVSSAAGYEATVAQLRIRVVCTAANFSGGTGGDGGSGDGGDGTTDDGTTRAVVAGHCIRVVSSKASVLEVVQTQIRVVSTRADVFSTPGRRASVVNVLM